MNNKERRIIAAINNAAITESEINLYYDLNDTLFICNDTIQLNRLNCSLSNFKQVLTMINNKQIITRSLNRIEIYI